MSQTLNWVKASVREPSFYDADSNGKVLVRYVVNDNAVNKWSFALCDYRRVHFASEWAEGLVVNMLPSGWLNKQIDAAIRGD